MEINHTCLLIRNTEYTLYVIRDTNLLSRRRRSGRPQWPASIVQREQNSEAHHSPKNHATVPTMGPADWSPPSCETNPLTPTMLLSWPLSSLEGAPTKTAKWRLKYPRQWRLHTTLKMQPAVTLTFALNFSAEQN